MLGSDNNADTFWVDLGAGQPAQVLGRDLYEYSGISSTFSAGTVAIYGDLAKYRIVDHIGETRLEFVSNLFGRATGRPSGQRGWLLWWRTAADMLDTDAARVLALQPSCRQRQPPPIAHCRKAEQGRHTTVIMP